MHRRLVIASAIAVLVTAAFLSGSGVGSSAAVRQGTHTISAGLAAAIHARLGRAPIRSADPATEHPQFGFDVALSADGTTALVSAPTVADGNGGVYVYHVASAGSWTSSSTPTATLAGTGEDGIGEGLGLNVALSADGTTAFVAAPFLINGGGTGAVHAFHVADESAWVSTPTPTATLTVGTSGQFFGTGGIAVSPDGTTLVAGDPAIRNYAGGAYVFHASSEDAWASTSTPTATLSNAADDPGSDTEAGLQVAISGDGTTVLLGAADSHDLTGRAYLFHVASEAGWISSSAPTATLFNANGAVRDLLGTAVALSGDGTTAFLGAPGVKGFRGAVDVFHVANEGLWISSSTPTAILTNGAGANADLLGNLLAVSDDGKTVVAGALGVHRFRGAAYVFRAAAEDAWTSSSAPTAALTDSAGAREDLLGASLASSADGATVLLGAPWVNWKTGKADVFHVADAGSWVTSSTPTATLTNSALPKPKCVVPNLKKRRVLFARGMLADVNCRLGTVKRVHSIKKNRGRIVSQSPARGRRLPPGSKVNVKVGR